MAKGDICVVCGDTYKARVSSYEGEHKGEPLCNKHLLQIKRNGIIVDPLPSRRRDKRECEICGDTSGVRLNRTNHNDEYKGKLLCHRHYSQIIHSKKITDPHPNYTHKERICSVCGQDDAIYRPKDGEFYCRRHYDQLWVYGKIFDRTMYDKNEIVIKDTYAEVLLYNVNHEVIAKALVDLEDVDLIKQYKWGFNIQGYATANIDGRQSVGMHKVITNTTNVIVDHKNRNGLDNRRKNLVLSNKSKNAINAGLRSNNRSGVTGVSYYSGINKWRAYINYEGKRIELGYFADIDDAIKSRLNAELNYYPDNPPQKDMFERYDIKRGDDVG